MPNNVETTKTETEGNYHIICLSPADVHSSKRSSPFWQLYLTSTDTKNIIWKHYVLIHIKREETGKYFFDSGLRCGGHPFRSKRGGLRGGSQQKQQGRTTKHRWAR